MFAKSSAPAACILVLFVLPQLHAQNRGDEPPVVGRPANFSHVVGTYQIDKFSAQPTKVFVEDPITVTILISGKGPTKYEPKQALLHLFDDDVEHDFYITPVPERGRVYHWRHRGLWRTWEFVYLFRPKSTNITELPKLRLSYYRPGWGFATAKIDADIRIKVEPRPVLTQAEIPGLSKQAPERLYHLITGDAILTHDETTSYMTAPLLLAVGIGAPAVSWFLLVLWHWLLPDGVRQVQHRRSQAARRAVRELDKAGPACSPDVLARILTGYLSRRLDFPGVEATPAEVTHFLRRRGVSPAVRQQWAELFRAFDEVRYTPASSTSRLNDGWSNRAAHLIQTLEADPCLARAC